MTTRHHDDTWDIATSVGATAVLVAAARAAETVSADPLIRDEFAAPLISTPELADLLAAISAGGVGDPDDEAGREYMVTYQAVRTHYFDAFFAAATSAGIDQIVILASGLDSRAYRLGWPEDTVIYELDLPEVLRYKSTTLAAHGATPTAVRRDVAADLRQDWPKVLRDSGFRPHRPTAWLAEGLLPFLPGPAQDAMFARIDELSAPGSHIAAEAFPIDNSLKNTVDRNRAKILAIREERGDQAAFDFGDLWYDDEGRTDCAAWFDAHGWTATAVDSRNEVLRLGRPVPSFDENNEPFVATFVVAVKG